jgi:hypothetical protein
MKPFLHAKVSVSKWGGVEEDYLPIHDFLDSSKACHADMRHRAILHSSFGCYVAERVFGHNVTISTGKLVSVRDVAEQHIIDDMGRIPSVGDYLNEMPFYDWLGGSKKSKTVTVIPDDAPSLNDVMDALSKMTPPDDSTVDNARFMPRNSRPKGYRD